MLCWSIYVITYYCMPMSVPRPDLDCCSARRAGGQGPGRHRRDPREGHHPRVLREQGHLRRQGGQRLLLHSGKDDLSSAAEKKKSAQNLVQYLPAGGSPVSIANVLIYHVCYSCRSCRAPPWTGATGTWSTPRRPTHSATSFATRYFIE